MWIKTTTGELVNLANFKGVALYPGGSKRSVFAYYETYRFKSEQSGHESTHPNLATAVFLTDYLEKEKAERFLDRLNTALGGYSAGMFLD